MMTNIRITLTLASAFSFFYQAAVLGAPVTVDAVEQMKAQAELEFEQVRDAVEWREELPDWCAEADKTSVNELLCELEFRETTLQSQRWQGSEDCGRTVMIQQIRQARQRLFRFSDDPAAGPYLEQSFSIDGVMVGTDSNFVVPRSRILIFIDEPFETQLAASEGLVAAGCEVTSANNIRSLIDAAVFLNGYIGEINLPAFEKAYTALRATSDNWKLFLEKGRSQFPWEVAVNEWVGPKMKTIHDLPEYQWVFLHPSPVLEYYDSNNVDWALAVEAIGMIFYKWDRAAGQNNRYFGGSIVLSLTDEGDAGVGLLFDYKGTQLGFNYRDDGRGGGDSEWSAMLSVDLFKAFSARSESAKAMPLRIQNIIVE